MTEQITRVMLMYSRRREEIVADIMVKMEVGLVYIKTEPEVVTEDAVQAVADYLRDKDPDAESITVPVTFPDGRTASLTLAMNPEVRE